VSWEGRDPARDEDAQPWLCSICALAFHTRDHYATTGCGCLKHGCGCRDRREQKEAA